MTAEQAQDLIDLLRALIREALAEDSIGYVLGTDWVERAQSAIQPADPSTPTHAT